MVRPPGRERVIKELCEIHVHPGITRMKSWARSRVVGEPGCRPGSPSANLYQVSVKSAPRIGLMPRFSCMSENEGQVF